MWVSPLFLPGVLPGAVWMDSNKAFPVSFSLTYSYRPPSRTLSGFNSGGCQLHFLVAGRKVTITVLPCATRSLACCGTSAPLLAGERSRPGFGVHLRFFGFPFLRTVGESWTKRRIWKDDLGGEGEVHPDRLSCDFRSHEINLIKTQRQIWLVKNWGMGGRGILPSWNHLGAWMFAIVYSVIYGCLFIFLFNGNIYFFFFYWHLRDKILLFFLSLFSLLAPAKHNPTHLQQWIYGNIRDVSVTGEKLTTSKRLKRVFFLFCFKYIYIYIFEDAAQECALFFFVVVKLQFSYG